MFEFMADNAGDETGAGGSVAATVTEPAAAPATSGTATAGATAPEAAKAPEANPFTDGTKTDGAPATPGTEPAAKTTPKEVSDAINRATARYTKELERYKKRDEETAANLKAIGLPADINLAAAQIMATANNIPLSDAIARQTASRDMEILGKADAAEVIESGDIEAELKRLADKPIPLRTQRDKICYQELTAAKKLNDEAAELSKVGVDVEKLKKDSAFAEFNKKLNPELPISERYELYKKTTTAVPAATPPPSVASKGGTPKKDFYTSAEVDHMTRDEISENLEVITKSMKKW